MFRNSIYFTLKPLLPDRFRTLLRKWHSQRMIGQPHAAWPINEAAGRTPLGWCGWPGGKQFAVILTHDVEGPAGLQKTMALAAVEESKGFRSSFNFVPEGKYQVTPEIRSELASRGFEVGVHDLHHDGKLYASREAFRRNAQRINHHIREWKATGFRSAYMLHRIDWLHDLEIEYDASTFDADPIEPQPDAASTIFPFWVPRPKSSSPAPIGSRPGSTGVAAGGFVELPYTLPQDSTMFLFLGHKDISVWKRKVAWIAERGGMVLLNLHPDYVSHGGDSRGIRKDFPVHFYQEFLQHLHDTYSGSYWHALPREVNQHIRSSYPEGGPRRPRHACMLSYSFFEQDNRVQRYARALAARGDSVDVLSLGSPSIKETSPAPRVGDMAQSADPSVYFAPGIRVFHVQNRTRNERRVSDYALRMLTFFTRSFHHINAIRKLRQFDVIHVHNVPDFLIFAAWLAKKKGSRLILDLHDLLPEFYAAKFHSEPGSLLHRLTLFCERISCQFADHVIVSNQLWRDKVAARTGLGDKCTTMVNHVDTQAYRAIAANRPPHSPDRPSIAAFPGGFYHHQGLHIAIQALDIVRRHHPSAQLHLMGDGPEREPLQAQILQLGLSDHAKIHRPVPITEVPAFLATADIGIVPKLADGFGNEAYSTKIMEFMAAGLPVIASRTRIDEFYFGKGEVHFFDSGKPESLAKAWLEVLENADLRSRLIQKGSNYVAENGWERHTMHYFELFDGLTQAQ